MSDNISYEMDLFDPGMLTVDIGEDRVVDCLNAYSVAELSVDGVGGALAYLTLKTYTGLEHEKDADVYMAASFHDVAAVRRFALMVQQWAAQVELVTEQSGERRKPPAKPA